MMTSSAGSVRWVRQLMALKLGYRKWLNIMYERNTISGGSANFHAPMFPLALVEPQQ